MRVKLFILFLFISSYSFSQSVRSNPQVRKQTELTRLMEEVVDVLKVPDLLYRRVSIVSFDYPDFILSESEASQIRSRIEGAFARSGFVIISAPEFKQKALTIVSGTDSNLKISRQNSLERLLNNEKAFSDVIEKYAIQGVIYAQLTYDYVTGYQLNLQLLKSNSKELLYSTIVYSDPKLYVSRSMQTQITAGYILNNTKNYLINNKPFTGGSFAGFAELGVHLRQPFTPTRSGYYGITGGLSLLNLIQGGNDTAFRSFSKIIPTVGFQYSLCFFKKNDLPREYWMEAFQSVNLLIADEWLPVVRQGITVNATKNMSVQVDLRYYLISSNLTNGNNLLQLNNFGYGLNIIYRPKI